MQLKPFYVHPSESHFNLYMIITISKNPLTLILYMILITRV